jgi:hypothetical protein
MNLSGLTLEDIQLLAAAANQAQQLSRQSPSTTPKPSAANTRTPTPTLNGATTVTPLPMVSRLLYDAVIFCKDLLCVYCYCFCLSNNLGSILLVCFLVVSLRKWTN